MFYNIYGKDAAIIAHLLGYKLFLYGNKLCLSFPSSNLEMVTGRLRIMDIAYIIVKGKYKEVYVGNPNKYIEIYKIASLVPDKKILLNEIFDILEKFDYDELKEFKKIIE